MTVNTLEFATKPELLRRALQVHRAWVESKLGVPFSDVAILETNLDLTGIAVDILLGRPGYIRSRTLRRFRPLLLSAELPPELPPMLEMGEMDAMDDLCRFLGGASRKKSADLLWGDSPVVYRVRDIASPMIAVNVAFHAGPHSDFESVARILLVRRECAAQVVSLVQDLDRRDKEPRLHFVGGGGERRIVSCDWDDLVLDSSVTSLLKDDIESFFEREEWFRKNRLPFRRGYLLHGPPGNGKSTAIRAMMTSRGLTAYTLRLFDRQKDDSDLDHLFEKALRNRPSMVLLEDIDRAFPKTGESRTSISVQQLLNCLDGVGSGEGIIVVATANEPTILDPAILRRPGRFDRVVHFPNPDHELRGRYFRHVAGEFGGVVPELAVAESEGFSFAQLRETFILAGQRAFERKGEINEEDLLTGIRRLRSTMVLGSTRSNAAGFRTAASPTEVTA